MPFRKPCWKQHIHARRARFDPSQSSDAGERIAFHYGRERGILLEEVDETQLLLFSLLDGHHTFEDLVWQLHRHDSDVTAEIVSEVLEQLNDYGLLEDASTLPPTDFSPDYLERYASQLRFFSLLDNTGRQKYAFQSRIKHARVAVLGLGGLGCNLLLGLAAIGVGFLRGVDFDRVERGNLNRQVLYEIADIGKLKTEAAAEHLARFNPEVSFEAVQQEITGPADIVGLIKDMDLVAFCADRPKEIPRWMNQAALETGIPFLRGGYHGTSAEVGPLVIPYETACLECEQSEYNDEGSTIAELTWMEASTWLRHPNIHFLTALAANLLCSDICKQITGMCPSSTYNTRYTFDMEQFTLTPTPLVRMSSCLACGQGQ